MNSRLRRNDRASRIISTISGSEAGSGEPICLFWLRLVQSLLQARVVLELRPLLDRAGTM